MIDVGYIKYGLTLGGRLFTHFWRIFNAMAKETIIILSEYNMCKNVVGVISSFKGRITTVISILMCFRIIAFNNSQNTKVEFQK